MSFMPDKDRQYFAAKGFIYKEVTDGRQKGVIIEGFSCRLVSMTLVSQMC